METIDEGQGTESFHDRLSRICLKHEKEKQQQNCERDSDKDDRMATPRMTYLARSD
jgi:hypothetical protein